MRSVPTNLVHAQILAPYERVLRREGAPVEKLFSDSGIRIEAVYSESALLTMRQAYRLTEEAARYAGTETLGSTVGRGVTHEELGATSAGIRQSASLFDARLAMQRAVHAAEPGSRLWMEQHDEDVAWLCYRPERRFAVGGGQSELFDLQCLLKLVRLAGGEGWKPRAVRSAMVSKEVLEHVPELAESELCFSSDGVTAVAFPAALLVSPLAANSEGHVSDMGVGAVGACAQGDWDIAGAVSAVLESLRGIEEWPSLEGMADRFGVTCRTLQRALSDCDTSYRQVTERVRFRQAAELLGRYGLPVKEVSAELGYGSPTSFIRAFRKVAGMTPKTYKKIHAP